MCVFLYARSYVRTCIRVNILVFCYFVSPVYVSQQATGLKLNFKNNLKPNLRDQPNKLF